MTHHNNQVFLLFKWLTLPIFLLFYSIQLEAQVGTPTYFNATGTTSNAFPWNSTTSNKVQYIYAPNVFSTGGGGAGTPAPSGYLITKVYVKFSATVNATNTYTNFTISMAQNLGAINNFPQTPASTGVPFYSGLTQVFYQSSGYSLTGITANAWYGFTLQTPFAYNPTQALLVEMKCSGGTGNAVATVTTAGISQRIYAGYAATTGTANTLLTPLGFDMLPGSVCTSPPTPGTATITNASPCIGQNFDLSLSGASAGSGQTYQWQSGPTSSGPWTNVGGSLATPLFTTNTTTATYYRCQVTCSGNSQFSIPVFANVPVAFPGGTYTIDKTQPASATNFISFAAAMSAMGCGISGPVTLNVVSGTGPYNEQVLIPSTIGTNSVNTLTINGNGNTLTVPANTVNLYTLGLDGADYVTVNNLVIEGTDGTSALTCHLWNNADYNTFNNCTFKAPLNSTATTTSPFSCSGSATTVATSGNSGSYNVLNNCTAIGGYYSIVFYGNSSSVNVGNKVMNCTAQDFYTYGIYSLYQNGWEVNGCIVERPNRTSLTTCYGIYASTSSAGCIIRNNRVRNTYAQATTNTGSTYCIYVSTDGSTGNENQVYNNIIYDIKSAGLVAGIYTPSADYTVVYHNTISLDDASSTQASTTYGIYNTGTVGGIDIRNNIVSITRGGAGTKYCLYYTGTLQNSNTNVLYLNASGGTNYTGYNGTAYATLAAWQTASGKDLQSVAVNPLYNNAAAADFTPTSAGVSNIGSNVGIVTTDINGLPRNLTAPDPGAIEFVLASLDMSFPSISSPITTQGCYGSNETIVAVIKNSGNDPIDFSLNPVTVTVNVNGAASYTVTETLNFGTLGINQTQAVNLSPAIDMTVDGVYSFSGNVYVAGDANNANDNITAFNITVGITPGTITSSLSNPVCYSQNPTFTLSGQYGGTRQWQISTVSASGPWTNVGTGGTTYTATGQNQNYWIQVESNCNVNYAYSNVLAVTVNNPALLSTTPGSRCGTGTVNLAATPNGTATVNWYQNATGGLPLGSGTSFTTPSISSTTTFYAAATDGGGTLNTGLPNRVGATTNSGYSDIGLMFDALQPFTLNSVAIYPVATTPTGNVTATIALKNSAGTILQSITVSVPTSVSPGIKTVVPLGFNVPMGTGHRLVFTSASGGGITGFIRELTTGFTYPYTIPGVSSITSAYTSGASNSYYYYFYDWSVTYGCEGSRTPVVATVNTAPPITVSALSTTLCPGESTDISVLSANDPNYDYSWTSSPAGFTATGAGPHSVTPNAVVTYSVTATDNTSGPYSGCVAYGTVTVNSAATVSGGSISANLSDHCYSGSSILTSSGTSGGPIQWEVSTTSASGPWSPVGTGSSTYTTPTLTQTTYYRVSVTCGATTNYSAVKTITVNTPTISTTTAGETCGSGTVNLSATAVNPSDNIRWYANASGGTPLATGNTYTTPVLASTTTYYAAPVSNGAGSGTSLAIPLASGATTGVYHHMFLISATSTLFVTSFGIKCNNTLGTATAWDIYYRPDNYQTVTGANTSSSGWTLLSSVTNVPSLGATDYTIISSTLGLAIPAGATYSFYIAPGTGTTHQYATNAIGTTVVSNSDFALKAGNRGSALFNCATSGGMACVKVNYSTGCEGTRVPVVASVGPVVSMSGLGASYLSTDAPVTLSGTPGTGSFSGPGISGNTFSPSLAGVGTHTITYSVPGTTCNATQTVTVTPPPIATLNLKFYLQGYYIGSGSMQPVLNNQGLVNPTTDCDDVTVELHQSSSPYALVQSFTGIVHTDGTVSCTFPSSVIGNSYYIVVLQRNHVQTWSANPVTLASTTTYDFSTAMNKAYGDNQWEVETGVFAFYAGDVNQDLAVDGFDYIQMDPDIVAGNSGYLVTDVDGNGSVDAFDFLLVSPNIDAGITIQAP